MNELISEYLRPTSFDEISLPSQLKEKLKRMYESKEVMNMLFYGKPGTGKTTAAKIFTESGDYDVLEINGSLDNSIEDVRDTVRGFSHAYSLFSKSKICFIDEADHLSKNAQAALRNMIEKTSNNCRFIFTANEISKIHPALCSRLLPICFDMTTTQTSEQLEMYTSRTIEKLKKEKGEIDEKRIKRLIELYYPDFRVIASQIEFEFV